MFKIAFNIILRQLDSMQSNFVLTIECINARNETHWVYLCFDKGLFNFMLNILKTLWRNDTNIKLQIKGAKIIRSWEISKHLLKSQF